MCAKFATDDNSDCPECKGKRIVVIRFDRGKRLECLDCPWYKSVAYGAEVKTIEDIERDKR